MSGLLHLCTELTLFCIKLPEPAFIWTNQIWVIIFMYVISTEIFRIFPAIFDFSHSCRNIELFIVILRAEPEISKEARRGNSSEFEDFLGLMVSYVLSVILREFWSRFSKICLQISILFSRCMIIVWNANNRAFLAKQQPAGLFINIDEILSYQLLKLSAMEDFFSRV